MSTRSLIGVQSPTGAIQAIYCHFDGYPAGVGLTLQTHHNSAAAAEAIIALGDLSYLAEKLAPEAGQIHSFVFPATGVTMAYNRDRGETGIKPRNYNSAEQFLQEAPDDWADYIYLFREGAWFYSPVHYSSDHGSETGTWQACAWIAEAVENTI